MIEKNLIYNVISIDNNKIETKPKNIKIKINNSPGLYNIHRVFTSQLKNKRHRKANTKTRSEIRGGGKKPWKQKGSGKARAGSSRSPLWKGGGVIFGPKTRKLKIKINKKEKQLALRHLLYNKFQNTFIIQNFAEQFHEPKTKKILSIIKKLNIETNRKILIIIMNKNRNLYLSTRNLPNIKLIYANQLNIIALLQADTLLMTIDALEKINEVYNG